MMMDASGHDVGHAHECKVLTPVRQLYTLAMSRASTAIITEHCIEKRCFIFLQLHSNSQGPIDRSALRLGHICIHGLYCSTGNMSS